MPLYKLPNIPQFLIFRVFFNARFYYPVFALMFLEFGLSVAQFSASNLVWAVAIVVLEVPSGALADLIGRKRLVVLAALLMIVEMAVLLVARPNSGNMVLFLFCLNRLLSGAGEAMASGADEALTYDGLKEVDAEDRWSEVLEWQTRATSVAMFIAMIVGAAVYDPAVWNKLWSILGWEGVWTKADTLKLPIWLTLGNSVIALGGACFLKPAESERAGSESPAQIFKKTGRVMKAVWERRPILVVIFAAVLFDQASRVSLTLSSKTLSAYGIGEAWFGVIAACFALLGVAVAGPARKAAENRTQAEIFAFMICLSLVGLVGQAAVGSYGGLLFIGCLSILMNLVGFFSSFYLNRLSESEERATLLSLKGLACNMGFGLISLYYSGVTALWTVESSRQYLDSLYALGLYFVVACLVYVFWYKRGAYPQGSGEKIKFIP